MITKYEYLFMSVLDTELYTDYFYNAQNRGFEFLSAIYKPESNRRYAQTILIFRKPMEEVDDEEDNQTRRIENSTDEADRA